MKKIKDLLSRRVVGKKREADGKSVESAFFDVLEKRLSKVARADILDFRLKDKKLYIRTTHPAITSEIWRKREGLRNEINDFLESEIIEEIKVK